MKRGQVWNRRSEHLDQLYTSGVQVSSIKCYHVGLQPKSEDRRVCVDEMADLICSIFIVRSNNRNADGSESEFCLVLFNLFCGSYSTKWL